MTGKNDEKPCIMQLKYKNTTNLLKIMLSEAISWTAGSKADGQKREK